MTVMIKYRCTCGPRTLMEQVFEPGARLRRCSYNGCSSMEDAERWIEENSPKMKNFRLDAIETVNTDTFPVTVARVWTEGSTDAEIVRGRY